MPKILSPAEIAGFRDRLCDAAERMFAERGAEAVTIRELASAVGVSPMTPYRYFKDKEAILAAVRARAFDRHAEALELAYAGTPPKGRGRAMAEAYVRFALENPEAYKLMFEIRQPNEADHPELMRAGMRARRMMTAHVADAVAAGRISGDADLIGHVYWAAMHGALMLHFAGKLGQPTHVERLIEAILSGIQIRPGLGESPRRRSRTAASAPSPAKHLSLTS